MSIPECVQINEQWWKLIIHPILALKLSTMCKSPLVFPNTEFDTGPRAL